MKSFLFILGGVCAALAFYVAREQQRLAQIPVDQLARKLETAWADHHTVV